MMEEPTDRKVVLHMGEMDDVMVWLVVDEWDLESDEERASEEDAGVYAGQRFGFDASKVLSLIGAEGNDVDALDRAVISLLEGEDVKELQYAMMDSVSDATGWCVAASHAESVSQDGKGSGNDRLR